MPLLSGILFVAAGCSSAPVAAATRPTVEETAAPVVVPATQLPQDVVNTGLRLLDAPGFNWVGSPRPVLAQQMSYLEASQKVILSDPQYDVWPPETSMWLVIFEGQWDLMPMGPPSATLVPIRYQGCLLVLFTASGSERVAAGDSVCPVQ